jgi:hypothetical protein
VSSTCRPIAAHPLAVEHTGCRSVESPASGEDEPAITPSPVDLTARIAGADVVVYTAVVQAPNKKAAD